MIHFWDWVIIVGALVSSIIVIFLDVPILMKVGMEIWLLLVVIPSRIELMMFR